MKRTASLRLFTTLSHPLWFVLAAVAFVSTANASDDQPNVLRVATHDAPPFVILTESGAWQGAAIDLWYEIAAEQAIEFEFVDLSVADAIDGLQDGSVDVVAMALTATADRERLIDFSHPFGSSGLAMAVKVERSSAVLRLLEGLVSWEFASAVLALVSVLLGAGACVWFFERDLNPEQFGGRTHRGLGNSFWWSAVTMTTVGYGDLAPKTLGGRLVALIWMFTSVIIISGFTASIASSITTSNLVSERKKSRSLSEMRVGTVEGTTSSDFLESIGSRIRPFPELREALEAVLAGEIDAVVYDEPILKYLIRQDFDGVLEVLPGILQREDYAFAFPEDSNLREVVNESLLLRINNGRLGEIRRRYLGDDS